MAPSESIIESAISQAVTTLWFSPERDHLSVNTIRAKVEKQLKLPDDFLKTGAWKEKSKTLIKTESVIIPILSHSTS
jgi:hypothetical protein